jgi:hypothetical protein
MPGTVLTKPDASSKPAPDTSPDNKRSTAKPRPARAPTPGIFLSRLFPAVLPAVLATDFPAVLARDFSAVLVTDFPAGIFIDLITPSLLLFAPLSIIFLVKLSFLLAGVFEALLG